MPRKRPLVSYQELKALLLRRYSAGECTDDEWYAAKILIYEDPDAAMESLLFGTGPRLKHRSGGGSGK